MPLLETLNTKFLLGADTIDNLNSGDVAVLLHSGHYYVLHNKGGKIHVWESLGLPLEATKKKLSRSDLFKWGDVCYQYANTLDSTTTCGLYAYTLAEYINANGNADNAVDAAFSTIVECGVPQADDMKQWHAHNYKYALELMRNDRQILWHAKVFYPTLLSGSPTASNRFSPLPNTYVGSGFKSKENKGPARLTKDLPTPMDTSNQVIEPSSEMAGGQVDMDTDEASVLAARSGQPIVGGGASADDDMAAKQYTQSLLAQDGATIKKTLSKIGQTELGWVVDHIPPKQLASVITGLSAAVKKRLASSTIAKTWMRLARLGGADKEKYKNISRMAPKEHASKLNANKLPLLIKTNVEKVKHIYKKLDPADRKAFLSTLPPQIAKLIEPKFKKTTLPSDSMSKLVSSLQRNNTNFFDLPKVTILKLRKVVVPTSDKQLKLEKLQSKLHHKSESTKYKEYMGNLAARADEQGETNEDILTKIADNTAPPEVDYPPRYPDTEEED